MQTTATITASTKKTVRNPSEAKPKPTKSQKILALLRRSKGATIVELSKASNWQAHSVRGFLSGTVKKRMELELLSERDAKGIRRYRLAQTDGS